MILRVLEQDDEVVFVFNKMWFKQGASALPPDENAPVVVAKLPTQEQSLSSSSNLSFKANQDGVEPMHNAMLDFLKRFVHWKSMGEAYATAAHTRVQLCEKLQNEVAMQRRASALALTSLQRYYKAVAAVVEKLDAELAQVSNLVSTTLSYTKVLYTLHTTSHSNTEQTRRVARLSRSAC